MLKIRVSSLPRVTKCQAAAQEPKVYIDRPSDDATLGTAVNALLDDCLRSNHPPPDDLGPWLRRWGVDEDDLRSLGWSGWKIFDAIRPWFTGTLEMQSELVADLDGITLSGHPDLFCVVGSDAYLCDWKLGYREEDYTEQLRGYAWLLCQLRGVDRVYAGIGWLQTGDWEPLAGGGWLTKDELWHWWRVVAMDLTRPYQAYNPGMPQCRYCPRQHECDAHAQYLSSAVKILPKFPEMVHEILRHKSPAEQGEVYAHILDRIAALEKRFEVVKDIIRARVASEGGTLPAGDGREVVLTATQRKTIEPEPAWDYLAAEIGERELRACATLSKEKVGKAIMATAPRGEKSAAVRQVQDRLEEMGAIKTSSFQRLELRTVSPEIEVNTNGNSSSAEPATGQRHSA